jgi:hypothetical protein
MLQKAIRNSATTSQIPIQPQNKGETQNRFLKQKAIAHQTTKSDRPTNYQRRSSRVIDSTSSNAAILAYTLYYY